MYKYNLDLFEKLFRQSHILSHYYVTCLDSDTKRTPYRAELWEAGFVAGLEAGKEGNLAWVSANSDYNAGYNRAIEAYKVYSKFGPRKA